jgi:hypothetical protein
MKRVNTLVACVGFAMFSCALPVAVGRAGQQRGGALASGQQQAGPQHLGLLLAGKILVRHGHYVFYNTDTRSTFRIKNPAKAKAFKGKTVRAQGRVNVQNHTIYISSVNPPV